MSCLTILLLAYFVFVFCGLILVECFQLIFLCLCDFCVRCVCIIHFKCNNYTFIFFSMLVAKRSIDSQIYLSHTQLLQDGTKRMLVMHDGLMFLLVHVVLLLCFSFHLAMVITRCILLRKWMVSPILY